LASGFVDRSQLTTHPRSEERSRQSKKSAPAQHTAAILLYVMDSTVQTIRIFASSPSDVVAEIAILHGVVSQINNSLRSFGTIAELVRWETHAVPSAGRPQSVITASVGEYDIYLGVMRKRFGSPSGEADSGTEEEFNSAYESWFKSGKPRILFYFSAVPYVIADRQELKQLGKVLAFRDKLWKYAKALPYTYNSLEEFGESVRRHLRHEIAEVMNPTILDPATKEFLRKNEMDPRNGDGVRAAAKDWLSPTGKTATRSWLPRTATLLGVCGGILSAALLLNQSAATRSLPAYLLVSGNHEIESLDNDKLQASARLVGVKAELSVAQKNNDREKAAELTALANDLNERIASVERREAELITAAIKARRKSSAR
jgi:hypothetical protein